MEREYIRDRTLEGHESARARGKAIGGAAVTDDAMLAVALHLRSKEMSVVPPASDRIVSINSVGAAAVTPRLVGHRHGG
jgi:DNA invertase Pin-like site-specific DNA recombinase